MKVKNIKVGDVVEVKAGRETVFHAAPLFSVGTVSQDWGDGDFTVKYGGADQVYNARDLRRPVLEVGDTVKVLSLEDSTVALGPPRDVQAGKEYVIKRLDGRDDSVQLAVASLKVSPSSWVLKSDLQLVRKVSETPPEPEGTPEPDVVQVQLGDKVRLKPGTRSWVTDREVPELVGTVEDLGEDSDEGPCRVRGIRFSEGSYRGVLKEAILEVVTEETPAVAKPKFKEGDKVIVTADENPILGLGHHRYTPGKEYTIAAILDSRYGLTYRMVDSHTRVIEQELKLAVAKPKFKEGDKVLIEGQIRTVDRVHGNGRYSYEHTGSFRHFSESELTALEEEPVTPQTPKEPKFQVGDKARVLPGQGAYWIPSGATVQIIDTSGGGGRRSLGKGGGHRTCSGILPSLKTLGEVE